MTNQRAMEILQGESFIAVNADRKMALGLGAEALGKMEGETGYFILKDKVNDGRLVEVVRCEDCARYGREDKWCYRFLKNMNPDDFCSKGMRTNNEESNRT